MISNIILDFGHGGVDDGGNYTTAPNKMFIHTNGEHAYEGFINRQIGGIVEILLRSHRPVINVFTTVDVKDPRDISLSHRVQVANQYPINTTLFVSIHSNAFSQHNILHEGLRFTHILGSRIPIYMQLLLLIL